ncbi:hypothetical protein QLX08_002354 [Tetragonisca angustula]|uniref:Uncharacterized protein n=1 Tax=Tetragonisca angustula TaxID=166442 RepID=A0AAW1ACY5_9HYME
MSKHAVKTPIYRVRSYGTGGIQTKPAHKSTPFFQVRRANTASKIKYPTHARRDETRREEEKGSPRWRSFREQSAKKGGSAVGFMGNPVTMWLMDARQQPEDSP